MPVLYDLCSVLMKLKPHRRFNVCLCIEVKNKPGRFLESAAELNRRSCSLFCHKYSRSGFTASLMMTNTGAGRKLV